MSHFYGILVGNRGEATRCGSKESGVRTATASWEGSVRVIAWYDAENDVDMVSVSLASWQGSGESQELYLGPISGKARK